MMATAKDQLFATGRVYYAKFKDIPGTVYWKALAYNVLNLALYMFFLNKLLFESTVTI